MRNLDQALQDFTAAINVIYHYSDAATIDGIRATQSDHLELMTFELAQQIVQTSDPILHENAKLSQTRPRQITHRTRVETVTASKTHRTQ